MIDPLLLLTLAPSQLASLLTNVQIYYFGARFPSME